MAAHSTAPQTTRVNPDSLEMDALMTYGRGAELTLQGRPTDALPYLAAGTRASTHRWEIEAVYATALNNAAFEQTHLRGRMRPRVRSSFEATRLLNESFVHFERAESLAMSPEQRTTAARRHAVLLANWGFTRDAERETTSTELDPKAGAR